MQRSLTAAIAAALVLASTSAFAQAKPNFAGKWTLIPDTAATGGGAAGGRGMGRGGGITGGLGQEFTAVQDEKTLTITRTLTIPARGGAAAGATGPIELKSVYNLDGSESKNTLTIGAAPVETTSKVAWDGSKLVITTTRVIQGNSSQQTLVLSLDASGNLVAQQTSGGRGGDPVTTTMNYKKG